MKAFEYAEGRTEAEILELLSPQPGHTEVIAGGTDLVGLMNKMIVTPERVVNILEVPSMQTVERLPDGGVKIGAVAHLDDLLEHPYLADFPAVTQAIEGINSMQLQAQGTLGGELCRRPLCWFFRGGSPLVDGDQVADGDNRYHAIFGNSGPAKFVSASRIAPALIALGAKVRILGPAEEDEQLLPVEQLYRAPRHAGQRETVLEPSQLLTHILLPPATRRSGTYEVRQSEGPDAPLAAAAAGLQFSGTLVTDARIVLGQVAPTPWISEDAAAAIRGMPVSEESAAAAGEAAIRRATPLSHNEYKVQLAKVAVKRAILRAAGQETGGF